MKLKLPLALLSALLCCYVSPVSARIINYFNPETSGSNGGSALTPNPDGSWASSGVGKTFGYLTPVGSGDISLQQIKSISFTSTQNADANFFANMYINLYSKQGGQTRLDLEVANIGYGKGTSAFEGVKTTWSTDAGNYQLKFIVNGGNPTYNPQTLTELSTSQANWDLNYLVFNVGDTSGTNPGIVDIYNMTLELTDGTIHTWSFYSNNSVWEVSSSQEVGDKVFARNIKLLGGESKTGGALVYMGGEAAGDTVRFLGGNKAIGEKSTFTMDLFERNSKGINMDQVVIDKVDNTPTNKESALITFEGSKEKSINITNLKATASGTNSKDGNKFGNQMGSILMISGDAVNNSDFKVSLSDSSFENCFASASDPKQGAENNWTTYGTQGAIYLNSIREAQLTNINFTGNSVSSQGNAALGGAICTWGSFITIDKSTFDGNSAQDLGFEPIEGANVEGLATGGAIYFGSSAWGGHDSLSALVKNSSFTNNKALGYIEGTASYGSARGGALYLENRWVGGTTATTEIPLTIEDTVFTGNLAASASTSTSVLKGGGAIFSRGTSLTVKVHTKDLVYSGNSATLDGVAKDELGGFLNLYTYTAASAEVTKTFQAKATFDIATGRTLTIGEGKAGYDSIAGTVGSLIVKDGEGKMLVNSSMGFYAGDLKVNKGTFALTSGLLGASTVSVAAGATFIAGVTGIDLVTALANKNITAERGATLGTYLTNEGDVVKLKHSEVMNSIQTAYGVADAAYTYWTKGKFNIDFSTDDSGAIGGLGEGSTVTVTGKTEDLTSGSINLAGGTADLTQVTGTAPISGSVVTGDSGTVVTTKDQTILFDANQNVGYSLNGGASDLAGAKLVVGNEAAAPSVTLSGDINAKALTVNAGTTNLSGTVQTADGITVGNTNQSTTAVLTNNGTVIGNVSVLEGNTLKGSGTYQGGATKLAAKSTFVIGNSPGQVVFGAGSSLDASDANYLFAVDGMTAAVQGESTSGTYSNIILRNDATFTGAGNIANIEVWKGLFDATSSQVDLTLITNEGDGTIDDGFFNKEALVSGQYAELLKNAQITEDADGNIILTGNLDSSYAKSVIAVDAAAYANSLWSSSQVLGDFAKLSRDQASAPRQKALNLWMSAMGDFSSVTGSQGYSYDGGGYGVGADYAFNKSWIAGAGFGQTWGTNKSEIALLSNKQDGTMFSLYGQYAKALKNNNSFIMDAYFGYAQIENKATASGTAAPAKWSDNAYAAGLRSSWALEAGKDFVVTPFVGLDFVTAQQGSITVGNRMYNDGKMHNLTMPIGIDFTKKFSLGGTQYLIPSVSVAYAPDISRKAPSVHSRVLGEDVKFTGVKPGRNAAIINVGTRWVITPAWSTAVNYTLEARSKMTNQAVNVGCNYSF